MDIVQRASSLTAILLLLAPWPCFATEGYYKDLFMDGGVKLTSRTSLPAADLLGLSMDILASSSETTQKKMMITSSDDSNGCLLYPDGAPRYRAIYVNGGSATGHGTSLGVTGRQRIRDFFEAGGSYTGSCAGAFLAMIHNNKPTHDKNGPYKYYLGIWPGIGRSANTLKKTHDIKFLQLNHPLVKKYPSLSDGMVSGVSHNGGCRFEASYFPMPKGTEYLGQNHCPSLKGLHGYYNVMAWKKSPATGRVVVTCSHPEGTKSGERRDFMAAILSYALDGVGAPRPPRGALKNGVPQTRNGADTRIGDKQYHYWTVSLPPWTTKLTVSLGGLSADCHLYLSKTKRPTRLVHLLRSDKPGNADEQIVAHDPGPGTWYVGVYGGHPVKNGASYTVKANWSVGQPPPIDGAAAPPDGALPADRGGPSAEGKQPAADGGAAPDGMAQGGELPDDLDGGCSCQSGAASAEAGPGLLLLLLALAVWRRRVCGATPPPVERR